MKTGAVICEYNPFHNGHKYHINQTKKNHNLTHMIGVMSGNFTQRGDVALLDKWKRTETALKNGIDLVIEIPVALSLGSAELFAMGGVTLLNSLNVVDVLSFGSESGDIELLKETAGAVHYAMEQEQFYALMRRGSSYPSALQKTIEIFYDDEIVNVITTPNNTLGIEYLKAINETGSFIKPVTVKRYGAAHDSMNSSDTVVSASKLRKMLVDNENVSYLMPPPETDNFAVIERLETGILAKLRTMSLIEINSVPNVLQGLENRIYKSIKIARSVNELLLLIKTKRYTMARLRRIILCAFLGITKADAKTMPQYIRILGMNERGREILAKAAPSLPIGTSLSDLMKVNNTAYRQGLIEERSGNLYGLAYQKPLPCGIEYTHKPIIL